MLAEKENKKARKQRTHSSSGQREEFSNGLQSAKKAMTASEALFRREGHHEDEHGYEASAGHGQVVKKKENKNIMKNILNVKHKKVLSLSKRSDRQDKGNNKSQSTQASTTFQA